MRLHSLRPAFTQGCEFDDCQLILSRIRRAHSVVKQRILRASSLTALVKGISVVDTCFQIQVFPCSERNANLVSIAMFQNERKSALFYAVGDRNGIRYRAPAYGAGGWLTWSSNEPVRYCGAFFVSLLFLRLGPSCSSIALPHAHNQCSIIKW